MRNKDYPIKSGYNFNPGGIYSFHVETTTYKTTKASTEDHQQLVEQLIDSFRYETNLVYITSGKSAVDLSGQRVNGAGHSYGGQVATLSADNPYGFDGTKIITIDTDKGYSKKVEEIKYSPMVNGTTDSLFKEILEGYTESDTQDSFSDYKYREYIEGGQHLYKITETSTVTIRINKNNQDFYTHANMEDGEYYVKVYFEDINLSALPSAYNVLDVLSGVETLDLINIQVEGSMYDDVNGN